MFGIAVLSLSLTVRNVLAGQAQMQRRLDATQRSLDALSAAIRAEHLTVTVDPQGRTTITPQDSPPQVIVPPSSGTSPATVVVPAGPSSATSAPGTSPPTAQAPPPPPSSPPGPVPMPTLPEPTVPSPTVPPRVAATAGPG